MCSQHVAKIGQLWVGGAMQEPLRGLGQAGEPGYVPLAYQYPVVSGTVPLARWAHAAAAVGTFLYIYGGVGPAVLDDLAVLDTELMVWRSLTPSTARPKDRPDKLHAAAMCAMGKTLLLFGGQQGRKHLRTLYSLNTEALIWRLVTPGGAAPAGREGHSLTAVDGNLAYLFGGQGKKLYNDFYLLRQNGSEWVELKSTGRVPSPRAGHSMVWDGHDCLVCFGGTTAGSTDSGLYSYSLSKSEWSMPETSGAVPSPRTHHSAVLLPRNTMLVFGGCNAQGVFFNDAYVLHLEKMQWSRVQPLNTPPPPRYHHSCSVVDSKVVMYGGINPKQAFDAVVLLETNFGGELGPAAEELAARMTGSNTAVTGASTFSRVATTSAVGGSVGGVPLVDDLMKLQLRDLLLKRNMEELHITAQQKAEAVEEKLKLEQLARVALHKEVLQLKLVTSEQELANSRLQDQLSKVQRALGREQAEHQATSAALADMRDSLGNREQQLAEARQLLDSMSVELGILSSRFHRLQQERDALKAAQRAAQPQKTLQQLQQPQQQQQQPAGNQLQQALVVPGTQHGQLNIPTGGGPEHSLQQAEMVSSQQAELEWSRLAGAAQTVGATSCSPTSVDRRTSMPQLQPDSAATAGTSPSGSEFGTMGQERSRRDEAVVLCGHGQLGRACMLCICQRFLAATAGSCSHLQPAITQTAAAGLPPSDTSGSILRPPSAAGLATRAVATCANGAVQGRQFLSISEPARNRLEAENSSLHQQVADLQVQVDEQRHQLCVFEALPAALSACTIQELNTLEDTLEASAKAVRQVVLQRSIAEYQRHANAESVRCAVCLEAPRRLAFNCGHQTCNACGGNLSTCPFCRQEITAKIKLFE